MRRVGRNWAGALVPAAEASAAIGFGDMPPDHVWTAPGVARAYEICCLLLPSAAQRQLTRAVRDN